MFININNLQLHIWDPECYVKSLLTNRRCADKSKFMSHKNNTEHNGNKIDGKFCIMRFKYKFV